MGYLLNFKTVIFSSPLFLFVFLPLTILGFAFLPSRPLFWRKAWLVLASLVFYGWWKWEYLGLLLASLGGNFLWGRWLAGHLRPWLRRYGMVPAR